MENVQLPCLGDTCLEASACFTSQLLNSTLTSMEMFLKNIKSGESSTFVCCLRAAILCAFSSLGFKLGLNVDLIVLQSKKLCWIVNIFLCRSAIEGKKVCCNTGGGKNSAWRKIHQLSLWREKAWLNKRSYYFCQKVIILSAEGGKNVSW